MLEMYTFKEKNKSVYDDSELYSRINESRTLRRGTIPHTIDISRGNEQCVQQQKPRRLSMESSRAVLERERQDIEQKMNKLSQKRYVKRIQLQKEKIKTLEASNNTNSTSVSSSDSSSENDCCNSRNSLKCSSCYKKDRIINRQLNEIETLRQQLRYVILQSVTPPKELYCDKISMGSDISTLL